MVVPTRDGGARFAACLAALSRQRPAACALVVVDSGSTDGTPEAARAAGAEVVSIDPADFDHGATRNLGAAHLPAVDAVVFLVQDAVPVGEGCLATLAAAALADGVAAATARQVAPAEAPLLTRATVARSPFARDTAARTGPFAEDELRAAGPRRWRELLRLDSVACAVRGPLFAALGHRRTGFGEDALLAFDLLWGGWALAHEPAAVVEHGHVYELPAAAERYERDARFFRQALGLRVRPGWLSVLKGLVAEVAADRRWCREHGAAVPLRESVALRWAQVAGQRRGSRGPLGRRPVPRPVPAPGAVLP